jgi:hypothetical protein
MGPLFNPTAIQFNIKPTIHHANAAITTSAISTNGAKSTQLILDRGFVVREAARFTVISLFPRYPWITRHPRCAVTLLIRPAHARLPAHGIVFADLCELYDFHDDDFGHLIGPAAIKLQHVANPVERHPHRFDVFRIHAVF